MFKSDTFGRAFWLDEQFNLKSCPLFVNNEPDYSQVDYVSEWTDMEGLELDKLLNIYRIEVLNEIKNEGQYDYTDYNLTEDVYNEVKKCYNFSNLEDNNSYIDSLLTAGI